MRGNRGFNPLLPIRRDFHRPRIEKRMGPSAGPWPLVRMPSQPGTNRISQHVSKHDQQMAILLDRKTLETALPEMAVASVMPVIAAYVGGLPPMHEWAESVVGRGLQYDVEMVRHQAETQHVDCKPGLRLHKQVEEGAIISRLVKHGRTAVATIENVVNVTGKLSARRTPHQTIRHLKGKKVK